MPDWDADSQQLRKNTIEALRTARKSALQTASPSLQLVRNWHRQLMHKLTPGDGAKQSWFGKFRGEPGQENVGMRVGELLAVDPQQVADQLQRFIDTLVDGVTRYDAEILTEASQDDPTELDREAVLAVIGLMAFAHGEWIRIHPFANGNGRTARLWANWLAMRYGLPPFVALRPRPDQSYQQAALLAMSGDWRAMRDVFEQMLHQFAVEMLDQRD